MSILIDMEFLDCLTVMPPKIGLRSVAFPRPAGLGRLRFRWETTVRNPSVENVSEDGAMPLARACHSWGLWSEKHCHAGKLRSTTAAVSRSTSATGRSSSCPGSLLYTSTVAICAGLTAMTTPMLWPSLQSSAAP
jgi:hypothetical protein